MKHQLQLKIFRSDGDENHNKRAIYQNIASKAYLYYVDQREYGEGNGFTGWMTGPDSSDKQSSILKIPR